MPLITVACKLPHGLEIRVGDKTQVLKGTNSSLVIGGHGITEGIDKDFFDGWLAANKDAAAVINGLIFAHGKTESVKAEAAEKTGNKNGFEGLNPATPLPGVEPMKA